jgi:hypothetical protein
MNATTNPHTSNNIPESDRQISHVVVSVEHEGMNAAGVRGTDEIVKLARELRSSKLKIDKWIESPHRKDEYQPLHRDQNDR